MPSVRDAIEPQHANREHWDHFITNLQAFYAEINAKRTSRKVLLTVLRVTSTFDPCQHGHPIEFFASIGVLFSCFSLLPGPNPWGGVILCFEHLLLQRQCCQANPCDRLVRIRNTFLHIIGSKPQIKRPVCFDYTGRPNLPA